MNSDEIIKLVSDIPSFILEDDIRLYHKYVSHLEDGSLVFDVGTGLGKSAIALGAVNPKVTVISMDSGDHAVQRGWFKDKVDYIEKIQKCFEDHKVTNVHFFYGDATNDFPIGERKIDLLHIDGEKGVEDKLLEFLLPKTSDDATLLIRNYDRFKDKVDSLCKDMEYVYLENMGKIQVIKKYKFK